MSRSSVLVSAILFAIVLSSAFIEFLGLCPHLLFTPMILAVAGLRLSAASEVDSHWLQSQGWKLASLVTVLAISLPVVWRSTDAISWIRIGISLLSLLLVVHLLDSFTVPIANAGDELEQSHSRLAFDSSETDPLGQELAISLRETSLRETNSSSVLDESKPGEDSQQNKLIEKSLIERSLLERLRCSDIFTRQQLTLIESELSEVFSHSSHGELVIEWTGPGTIVGPYKILSLLGEGGSGQVYRAQPTIGGKPIALKVLSKTQLTDRFRREMGLVERLAHPNIVVAYEVGEQKGMLYIAMEELSGPDLSVQVKKAGPYFWDRSVDIILQAARALEQAHQRSLIHRDVKPGNLLLDGDNRVKLTDLGLAALSQGNSKKRELEFRTGGELVAGTLDFMSPEQARSLSEATYQSDVYSLGATWFFLLTGRSRVRGSSLNEKLTSLLVDQSVLDLPDGLVPEQVRDVWRKMVAYSAKDRYQTMSDVIDALEFVRPKDALEFAKGAVEVLIVEDNQDDLFLTIELLRRINQSIRVHEAYSLAEAAIQCENIPTLDLVLLDLQLPDSSGVETVKEFKRFSNSVPIIVLTGQDDLEIGKACMQAGAHEFACKNSLNANLLERIIFVTLSRSQSLPT